MKQLTAVLSIAGLMMGLLFTVLGERDNALTSLFLCMMFGVFALIKAPARRNVSKS